MRNSARIRSTLFTSANGTRCRIHIYTHLTYTMAASPHPSRQVVRWRRRIVDWTTDDEIQITIDGLGEMILSSSVAVYTGRPERRPLFGPPQEGDEGLRYVFTVEKGAWGPSGDVERIAPDACGLIVDREKRRASIDPHIPGVGDAVQDAIDQDEVKRANAGVWVKHGNAPTESPGPSWYSVVENAGLVRPTRRRRPRELDPPQIEARPRDTTHPCMAGDLSVAAEREQFFHPQSLANSVHRQKKRRFTQPVLEPVVQRATDRAHDDLFDDPFFAAMKLPPGSCPLSERGPNREHDDHESAQELSLPETTPDSLQLTGFAPISVRKRLPA